MKKYNVTFEIIGEESAECGKTGFIEETNSLREAIKALFSTRTNEVDGIMFIESSDSCFSERTWITVYNGMEYRTGNYENRSLHFTGLTRKQIERIYKMYTIHYVKQT